MGVAPILLGLVVALELLHDDGSVEVEYWLTAIQLYGLVEVLQSIYHVLLDVVGVAPVVEILSV